MTAFTFTIKASDYGAETFRPGAFDRNIGKTIAVNTEISRTRQGTVLAAEIAEDGTTARITVDVADLPLPNQLGAASIGYNLPADGVNEDLRLVAQRQQVLAETGDAINQCLRCGSYRADELPPILHARDCPDRDAWKDNPLQYVDRTPLRQAPLEVAYAPHPFGPAPERIEVTYTAPARATFGELGWRDPEPATTEKMIEAAAHALDNLHMNTYFDPEILGPQGMLLVTTKCECSHSITNHLNGRCDTWYREPFELPPYVDDLGGVWSFAGERIGGPEPPKVEWPEDWPEDLRYLLFQAEVNLAFAESLAQAFDVFSKEALEGWGRTASEEP